jgi:hypothetical protein
VALFAGIHSFRWLSLPEYPNTRVALFAGILSFRWLCLPECPNTRVALFAGIHLIKTPTSGPVCRNDRNRECRYLPEYYPKRPISVNGSLSRNFGSVCSGISSVPTHTAHRYLHSVPKKSGLHCGSKELCPLHTKQKDATLQSPAPFRLCQYYLHKSPVQVNALPKKPEVKEAKTADSRTDMDIQKTNPAYCSL